jgi:type VI secretion system protein ImpC
MIADDPDPALDLPAIDRLLAECDRRLFAQLDALLHHPAVQALEATWRSLARLVDSIDPAEPIIVDLLHCTRRELADDFRESPEIARSGLYRHVYARAIGTYGATPYALVCADFDVGPDPSDIHLLRQCAAVAAIAHAPFITNAAPELFGLPDFTALPRLRDLTLALAGPRWHAWHALRAADDARNLGLCLPRVLLRAPHDPAADPTAPLRYRESISHHSDHLWGRPSYLFAALAAAAFARHRWCVHLLGAPASAATPLLELSTPTQRDLWRRCPLECQLPGRAWRALADHGLCAFVFDRATHRARLFAAPSVQRPSTNTPGEQLGTHLPYLLLASRFAHYLKCVQRERVGSWLDRSALQRELELWLRQYVADLDDPQPEVRARRPLRRAAVTVEPAPGQAGWYRCRIELQPHLSHNDTAFTLSLVGKLDGPPGDPA